MTVWKNGNPISGDAVERLSEGISAALASPKLSEAPLWQRVAASERPSRWRTTVCDCKTHDCSFTGVEGYRHCL